MESDFPHIFIQGRSLKFEWVIDQFPTPREKTTLIVYGRCDPVCVI